LIVAEDNPQAETESGSSKVKSEQKLQPNNVALTGLTSPYTSRWLELRDGKSTANASHLSLSQHNPDKCSAVSKRPADWDANPSLIKPTKRKTKATLPRKPRDTKKEGNDYIRQTNRPKLALTSYAANAAPSTIVSPASTANSRTPQRKTKSHVTAGDIESKYQMKHEKKENLLNSSIESIESVGSDNIPQFKPPIDFDQFSVQ
jgi:hypothetical protein